MKRVLVIVLASLLHLSHSTASTSSPIFLWANKQNPIIKGTKTLVSYEVVPDAAAFVSDVVSQVVSTGTISTNFLQHFSNLGFTTDGIPDTIAIYIGNQLSLGNLRKSSYSDALGNFQSVMSKSASSLFLPYSSLKELSFSSVQSSLQAQNVPFESVGCVSTAADSFSDLRTALESEYYRNSRGVKVLIICAAPESNEMFSNLRTELDDVEAVSNTISSFNPSTLFIYTSRSQGTNPIQVSHGRSLMSFVGFGSYTSCDVVCQTQVRWLEGIVAAIVLALASCAGLCCLYVLDTPTRFETPKDNQ